MTTTTSAAVLRDYKNILTEYCGAKLPSAIIDKIIDEYIDDRVKCVFCSVRLPPLSWCYCYYCGAKMCGNCLIWGAAGRQKCSSGAPSCRTYNTSDTGRKCISTHDNYCG